MLFDDVLVDNALFSRAGVATSRSDPKSLKVSFSLKNYTFPVIIKTVSELFLTTGKKSV